MLIKDQPKILEHDSIVALLPDKLAFRIVYLDHQDKYVNLFILKSDSMLVGLIG
jgi:hypothetical protein